MTEHTKSQHNLYTHIAAIPSPFADTDNTLSAQQQLQSAEHLVHVLQYWAAQTPDKEFLRFYPQGEGHYTSISFKAFYLESLAIAQTLAPHQGKPVLLVYQSGIAFLQALFACFMADVIAVPAYPPRKNQKQDRLLQIINDCKPALILSSEQVITLAEETYRESVSRDPITWFDTVEASKHANTLFASTDAHTLIPEICKRSTNANESIAFLQYTSGSTGNPKGVMVSHHNLVANVRMAETSFKLPTDSRCISWLPLFHDMGLIGAIFMPLYWGAGSWLMPPAAFLQKPVRWLALISEAGKTSHVASAAPNFAYQLCTDNIDEAQLSNLDLNQWVFALNGAEPIRNQTQTAFIERFARYGFKESAMGPSYGMAECTLLASTRQGRPLAYKTVDTLSLSQDQIVSAIDGNSTSQIASSGSNCDQQVLRIVEDGVALNDGQVGEIWLQGEHIAKGYWNKPELTQESFQAFTQDGQGPFLRTGDRGALVDGELFITGRSKDMLVIRGKNHYPQDIEQTLSNLNENLQGDACAAFTLDTDSGDSLSIVQETTRGGKSYFKDNANFEAFVKQAKSAIAKQHGIELEQLTLIRFASIPKTSSGKIQRYKCKEQLLNNELTVIQSWQKSPKPENNTQTMVVSTPAAISECSLDEVSAYIQALVARKTQLPLTEIPLHEELSSTGLDSVDLIQIAGELESWLEQPLDQSLLFESSSIAALSETLKARASTSPNNNEDGELEGFL